MLYDLCQTEQPLAVTSSHASVPDVPSMWPNTDRQGISCSRGIVFLISRNLSYLKLSTDYYMGVNIFKCARFYTLLLDTHFSLSYPFSSFQSSSGICFRRRCSLCILLPCHTLFEEKHLFKRPHTFYLAKWLLYFLNSTDALNKYSNWEKNHTIKCSQATGILLTEKNYPTIDPTWMDFKSIMLNGKKKTLKKDHIQYDSFYVTFSNWLKNTKKENILSLGEGGGGTGGAAGRPSWRWELCVSGVLPATQISVCDKDDIKTAPTYCSNTNFLVL